jgi:AraC-like DNA-binding protein
MSAVERHYSVQEVAKFWKLSEDTVRRLFREEPGVMKISVQSGRRKRHYVVLRVPESIVMRVHERLRQQAA